MLFSVFVQILRALCFILCIFCCFYHNLNNTQRQTFTVYKVELHISRGADMAGWSAAADVTSGLFAVVITSSSWWMRHDVTVTSLPVCSRWLVLMLARWYLMSAAALNGKFSCSNCQLSPAKHILYRYTQIQWGLAMTHHNNRCVHRWDRQVSSHMFTFVGGHEVPTTYITFPASRHLCHWCPPWMDETLNEVIYAFVMKHVLAG